VRARPRLDYRRLRAPGRPRGGRRQYTPSAPDGWRTAIDEAVVAALAGAVGDGEGAIVAQFGIFLLLAARGTRNNLIVPAHLVTDAILALPGYTGVSRSWPRRTP